MRRILSTALVVAGLLFNSAYANSSYQWIDSIPDITQTDPKACFPYGGVHLCGPCAISNSLIWLGEHGYERLLPGAADRVSRQVELVKLIASKKYMDSTVEWGTSPAAILQGVAKYIRDCGYEYSELSYQGWRQVPNRFNTGVRNPHLEWIKSGLKKDSAVWLNVGWYTYCPNTREYVRVGGHWVTLAGYGIDENGKEDPNILIIHDPGSKSGISFANDYAKPVRLETGKLVGAGGRTFDAAGFYKLTGGMKVHGDVDAGILDGAIRLTLKQPNVIAASRKDGSRKSSKNQ